MSYITGEATRGHQSTPALLSTIPDSKYPSALTDRRVTTGKKQLIYKGRRKEKKKQKVKQITLNEKEKPHSLLVPQISTYYHKDKKQKKKKKKTKKEGKQQEAPVSSYALYTSVENSWEVEKDT